MSLKGSTRFAEKLIHRPRWVRLRVYDDAVNSFAKTLIILLFVAMSVALNGAGAQSTLNLSPAAQQVEKIRIWHSPDGTRVVFDVSKNVKHKIFTLDKPLRLVIDIENGSLKNSLPALDPSNQHIFAVRTGRPEKNRLRFVFELKKSLQINDFILSPNELYGHRLVVDLTEQNATADNLEAVAVQQPDARPIVSVPSALVTHQQLEPRQFLVAIDAGHGGEDPGALGHKGSREKQITLAIAKKLQRIVDADPRTRSILIREGDYFINLHKRRQLARQQNADLFISIHADAFSKRSARGLSVFALSQSGATSAMASALAAKENASDLIGGVSLADKDAVLAKVLVDLSMTNTISESVSFGGKVLKELAKLGKLHSTRVEQAGFAVLKSPDIPSILIETGFITNPDEERKLRSDGYQLQIAKAIFTAIDDYLIGAPNRGTVTYAAASMSTPAAVSTASRAAPKPVAHDAGDAVYQSLVKPRRPRVHKVVRGDSLSALAERYGTSVAQLKRLNNLRSNTVIVGASLKLPGASSDSKRAAPKAAKLVAANSKPATHTVRRGESLSAISARYNVTIKSLKALNNLRGNTVYVGQKLRLPGGTSNQQAVAKVRYHKVKRGDTLSEIAERYGTTMNKIMRANSLRSRTVRLGQSLKIPST